MRPIDSPTVRSVPLILPVWLNSSVRLAPMPRIFVAKETLPSVAARSRTFFIAGPTLRPASVEMASPIALPVVVPTCLATGVTSLSSAALRPRVEGMMST